MTLLKIILVSGLLLIAGCSSNRPMDTVEQVDLERFMGDWYVIANIPTFLEKNAFNPVESYRLNPDGTVATTFAFNAGALDGEQKVYQPRGFIRDSSNAIWGMQFVWPIKADYRIVYLDQEYQYTVIGRTRRDYVWIMARAPQISAAKYLELTQFVATLGYDLDKLRKAEHSPD
ncbi:MAG: lipocalin family protein [Porticoccaceae bacterium]|jgi:apolipoprotein D and lipocalin family protein|nr:lipocalin family protein [Porticoccaceae bacterium]MDG1308803.1 lipocalin family protein [Porticoccaceae bacterium]